MAVLLGLIQGLLGIWSVRQFLGRLTDLIGKTSTEIINLNEFEKVLMKSFDTSYGKIFLICLLIFVLSITLMTFCTYILTNFAFKGAASSLSLWNVTVLSAVPYTLFALVGIILAYISYVVGQIVILAGIIISVIAIYSGVKESTGFSENKSAFITAISLVTTVLIVSLIVGAFIKGAIKGAVERYGLGGNVGFLWRLLLR